MRLFTLLRVCLYFVQSVCLPNLRAKLRSLSLSLLTFLITESYQGLSLGRTVTFLEGIHNLANSKNVLVKVSDDHHQNQVILVLFDPNLLLSSREFSFSKSAMFIIPNFSVISTSAIVRKTLVALTDHCFPRL